MLGERVVGVSEPHVVQFPPFGGGDVAVCGGVVPKVQTTSVKNGENRRVVGEVVCVLGAVVSRVVCRLYANP